MLLPADPHARALLGRASLLALVVALVVQVAPGGFWWGLAVGVVGAALTLGARRGGVLISLLILPLYVPTLIFGVSAVDLAASGLDPGPSLRILAALSLFALVLGPIAAAAALRHATE